MAEKKNNKDINDDASQSSENSDNGEFEPSDGAEDFEDYKQEGYHPTVLGEVFNGKYQVVQKLGWGYFSTVWLVNEKKTDNYFALKIQKSKKSYSEAAVDELEVLKALAQNANNPEWLAMLEDWNSRYSLSLTPMNNYNIRLLDNFCHFGNHGKHYCSIFEIMGPNLLDLIQFFEYQEIGMDLRLVKIITRQVLMGLDYMHRVCKVIHTDLKPENIMIQIQGTQLEEFISDLKQYKKKPLSMKFLKKLQETNSKNKKKQQKKKLKKQLKKQAEQTPAEAPKESQPTTADTSVITAIPIEDPPVKAGDAMDIVNESTTSTTKAPEETVPIDVENEENSQARPENKTTTGIDEEKAVENQIQPEDEQRSNGQPDEESKMGDKNSDNWSYTMKWKGHINVKLDKNTQCKIVDFGNGCWIHKHFTDNIQTREYRSPEAVLGINYKENTDIWSLACVVYEMITSNFLFKPKKSDTYSKDDDHLALMIEHIGKIPKNFALKGKHSRDFFNKNGQLLKIKDLKESSISEVLLEDNDQITDEEANAVEKFLLPMLEYDPEKRISAHEALKSEWLWT